MGASNSTLEVDEFYFNSTVLIYGVTGYLGALILEKILYLFSVRKVYVLVRKTKYMSAQERLKEILRQPIFDRLRKEFPHTLDKITLVEVDTEAPDFGIDKKTRETLQYETHIIFNAAISTELRENVRDKYRSTIQSTAAILDLARPMKYLKAFVHLSSFYAHLGVGHIKEIVYKTNQNLNEMLSKSKSEVSIINDLNMMLDGDEQASNSNLLLFNKKYEESIITEKRGGVKAGIFRLPIVISTYHHPFPGWTNNLHGPANLTVAIARGYIHVVHIDAEKDAFVVPADYCVNAVIVAACDIAEKYGDKEGVVPIYNFVGKVNNIKWGKFINMISEGYETPLEGTFSYPWVVMTNRRGIYAIKSIFFELMPTLMADLWSFVRGNPSNYFATLAMYQDRLKSLTEYAEKEISFENENVIAMYQRLSEKQRKHLGFDLQTIDWREYFHNYLPGIKTHFLKETDEERNAIAIREFKRQRLCHNSLKAMFISSIFAFIGWFAYSIFQ